MKYEKLPDRTERTWYVGGELRSESLRDGTHTSYDEFGNVTYHDKNYIEDTKVYRAKQRVENKKAKNLSKLEDKPKLQKVVAKIADSKVFKDIALKVAMRKANNGK